MAFRDLRRSLATDVDELHDDHLRDRYRGIGVTSIGEAPRRTPIRVCGEVRRMRLVPRPGSSALEVTISDGTGEAVALFTGRRHLGGLEHGRGLELGGVGRDDRGRLTLLNPMYTLMPKG